MTPDERLTRIENAIQALAERQAGQAIEIERNTAGIRDLIVVSRTLIEAQQRTNERLDRTDAQIQELRAALHGLIETVDRFIEGQGRDGQQ